MKHIIYILTITFCFINSIQAQEMWIENGYKIKSLINRPVEADDLIMQERRIYESNEEGNLISVEIQLYDAISGEIVPTGKYDFEYDTNENVTVWTKYSWNASSEVFQEKIRHRSVFTSTDTANTWALDTFDIAQSKWIVIDSRSETNGTGSPMTANGYPYLGVFSRSHYWNQQAGEFTTSYFNQTFKAVQYKTPIATQFYYIGSPYSYQAPTSALFKNQTSLPATLTIPYSPFYNWLQVDNGNLLHGNAQPEDDALNSVYYHLEGNGYKSKHMFELFVINKLTQKEIDDNFSIETSSPDERLVQISDTLKYVTPLWATTERGITGYVYNIPDGDGISRISSNGLNTNRPSFYISNSTFQTGLHDVVAKLAPFTSKEQACIGFSIKKYPNDSIVILETQFGSDTIKSLEIIAPREMEPGNEIQLSATINGESNFSQEVIYQSLDTSLATSSLDGLLIAKKDGNLKVVAILMDGSNLSDTAIIEIATCPNPMEAPVMLCQDKELTLDFNGEATLTAEQIDSGSYHGCYDVDLTLDKTLFSKDDIGVNTVTLTGTTSKGIAGTCQSTVTVEASSIHELNISKLNIEVIPMPFNEDVTIKFSSEPGNNTLLSILDLTGKVVFYEWINPVSKEWQINTEAYQSGVYILQIRNDKDLMIRRTVIKE